MTTELHAMTAAHHFTPEELQVLRQLRSCYQQDRDLFTDQERARLRFVRWLYVSGRLES